MQLKKMNNSYPESTVDFDVEFFAVLVPEVFCVTEINTFLEKNNLKSLDHDRLHFAKSECTQ